VAYNSRRSGSEGQTFVFRAEEAGTFALKFYKQDYINDYILNDHVQVIVSEAPERELFTYIDDYSRVVVAPRWPYLPGEEPPASERAGVTAQDGDSSAVSGAPSGGASDQPPGNIAPQTPAAVTPSGNTAPQTPAAVTPPGNTAPQIPAAVTPPDAAGRRPPPARAENRDDDSITPVAPPRVAAAPDAERTGGPDGAIPDHAQPEEYFRRAREVFEAGQVQAALAILDQFRRFYPLGSDEAWWLYGQFLEATGPGRDIRLALDYYRRLVREYPQSPRCNDARRRIAYLERFYLNIQ
jgi:TolA-binding protein